jgi:hypothetical protein
VRGVERRDASPRGRREAVHGARSVRTNMQAGPPPPREARPASARPGYVSGPPGRDRPGRWLINRQERTGSGLGPGRPRWLWTIGRWGARPRRRR